MVRFAWIRFVVAGVLVLGGAIPAFAQGQGNAVLSGTVLDSDGVVPGATVTATDAATSVTRSAVSNEQGTFRLLALPPGRYTISVEMEGFKKITIPDVALYGGETRDLGKLSLQVGVRSENITVTAEVTPVQTTASNLQRTVTGDQLTMIQVKGRDVFGMMKILPGVVDTTFSRDFAQWNSGRGLSINGGNSLNKNTTIDGVPVGEEGGDGTTHITPNIDAIGEVSVISSGYTAENGRQSSGLIRITTKSGTNTLRGSGWYNARRDEWNKNDYLREQAGTAKPFFAVNIGGYSLGGPVVIPGVIDSRRSQKKVYFFASQEYTDDLRPQDVTRTNLPTDLERRGDFSQTRITNGSIQPILDPLTGLQFPGNVIPAANSSPDCGVKFTCMSPLGQRMLNLLPAPNGVLDQTAGQQWTSNDARDVTPLHVRKNTVIRIDTQLSDSQRFSIRTLFDRDDSTTFNRVAPGIGSVNNMFPGNLLTGTYTAVMSNSLVNEAIAGISQNHWGFRVGTGGLNFSDYTDFYRSSVGIDPPRLTPYGSAGDPHLGKVQKDQYPYLPDIDYRGGDRAGLAQYRPSGGNGPLPRQNENIRMTFEDNLSWTKGRHNYKFGAFAERDSKTEPGSNDYNGVYNFGHSADNPLSTGNGYANALVGVFTRYDERDFRVDAEVRHWQWDSYAQDSWRLSPRFTMDYGLRVTHHGAVYETRDMNSAFDPDLWKANQAAVLYRPFCRPGGVPGNQACAANNRAAINPINGNVVSQSFVGTVVPGTGDIANGQFTGGLPGKKSGWYYDMPALSWAPRFGIAWDVTGDQKTAIRASGGIFYNFINRSQYLYNGGPLVSQVRSVLNSTLDELDDVARVGNLVVSPQQVNIPAGYEIPMHGEQLPQGKLQPEKNYQGNVALQRDIGFKTVAEVAWVGNFGRNFWRTKTANNIAPYAYGKTENLFRNEPINANFLRRDYPGLGAIRYLTTDDEILNYNALQVSVNRRLDHGLQMGLAYTLSKAEGLQGWDYLTEELYGKQGIRDRYYGPPSVSQTQDRRHILVFHYSYELPNPTPGVPILKWVLDGWEASGVTQFTTGNPLDPVCNTNLAGVENTDPSLSGITAAPNLRCELTGEPIFSGYTPDTSVADAFQVHFNPAAFRRPLPSNGIGNLGDAPIGVLRHPSWWNWDFTLSRRIPVKVPGAGRGGNLRLQLQLYNMWDAVQFTQMAATYTFSATGNTNANTGKYTQTTNPLNVGLTLRLDF
jgi:hypothetical protein